MLLALILAQALVPASPEGPIVTNPATLGRPFFEAFPLSGAGTSGVCSTTPPTGVRGEVLTATRASSAYCTKTSSGGYSTTGIQAGDIVLLSANQPRVEYDNDGAPGMRRESARTNWLSRSEAADNASWTREQFGGSALPLVAANAGTAPNGARTADRVWFDSCSADPSQSVLTQVTANSSARAAHSVFLRGCLYQSDGGCVDERLYDSGDGGIQYADGGAARQDDGGVGSGSISLCHYNAANAAAGNPCSTCNYVATEWRRCVVENGLSTGSTTVIGCVRASASYTGASNTGVADVLLWGMQQEGDATDARVTSYIPTEGAAATRATDGDPRFTVAYTAGAACVSMRVTTNYAPTSGTWLSLPQGSGNPDILGRFSGGNAGCYMRASGTDLAAGTWQSGTNEFLCTTARRTTLNGATATTTSTPLVGGSTNLAFGNDAFGEPINGIYSRIQYDPSTTRCSR